MTKINKIRYNYNSLCLYTKRGIYYIPREKNKYFFNMVSKRDIKKLCSAITVRKIEDNFYYIYFKESKKYLFFNNYICLSFYFKDEGELLEYLVGNL